MSQLVLRKFISYTIFESKKTQSKRLHSLTNSLTADMMRLLHGKKTKFPVAIVGREDYLSFDPKTKSEEFYEIMVGSMPLSMDLKSYGEDTELEDSNVYATLEIDRSAKKINVSGEDKDPSGLGRLGFTVTIEIPPSIKKQDYSLVRDQIANSVRHELEHLTQGKASDQEFLAYGRGEEYFTFLHSPKEAQSSYGKYLLRPEEIPAFVRGEAHNTKSIKELEANISNFLDNYIGQNLIIDSEKTLIIDTWLDWAERHINRKGF